MTPEQKYFFDMTGYLHLEGVVTGDALVQAQASADRYMQASAENLPPGFHVDRLRNHFIWHFYGFAFDRALEALTRHAKVWPIVKALMNDRPRLTSGNLMVNNHTHEFHPLHSARESPTKGPEAPYYLARDGKCLCDHLVVFFYLTDVYEGDGGLIILPGSHKSAFERPEGFFYPGSRTPEGGYNPDYVSYDVPPGVLNVVPKAGDVVMISEMVTHGALSWKPRDRDRRFLTLRYMPQFVMPLNDFPDEIVERLLPETQELIATASYPQIKKIVEIES